MPYLICVAAKHIRFNKVLHGGFYEKRINVETPNH